MKINIGLKLRLAQTNARNKVTATIQPVYFVPAVMPAQRPATAAKPIDWLSPDFVTASTPIAEKNDIQRSGDPAVEICQKTTGVTRKAIAPSHAYSRGAHSRTNRAVAAAASTPPK